MNNINNKNKQFSALITLFIFIILVIIPLLAAYPVVSLWQERDTKQKISQIYDELAESNAHMVRLTDYSIYFSNIISKLNTSRFPQNSDIELKTEIQSKVLCLYLFDIHGKRINWKNGTQGKRRISEAYMKSLLKLINKPGAQLKRKELAIAKSFSGDSGTLFLLSNKKEVWCNFENSETNRAGAIFRVKLSNDQKGFLLAWINLDYINIHRLAEKSVKSLNATHGNKINFAWLDLSKPEKNGCGSNRHLSPKAIKILSNPYLKSKFKLGSEFFTISDTPEGIRLISSVVSSDKNDIMDLYFSFIKIIMPTLFLLLIWQLIFNVQFNVSIKTLFTSLFSVFLIAIIFVFVIELYLFREKQYKSGISLNVQKASEMLRKIDQNFFASNADLLVQYKYISERLSQTPDASASTILEPLIKAQADGNIDFACYINDKGKLMFKAPYKKTAGDSQSFSSKYDMLISTISVQALNLFNYSKVGDKDKSGLSSFSQRPVEGILSSRAKLQRISFSGDETIAFIDIPTDIDGKGKGFLFIAHKPAKLRMKYLHEASIKLEQATGFTLAAFPKDNRNKSTYFPSYSYFSNKAIWMLHDLVNQTDTFTWKCGKDINDRQSIIVAVPGHNIKTHNLFILMPFHPVIKNVMKIVKIFFAMIICSIVLIGLFGIAICKTIITPVIRLCNSIKMKKYNSDKIFEYKISTGSELERIDNGINSIISKIDRFREGQSLNSYILPHKNITNGSWEISGHHVQNGLIERETFTYLELPNNQILFAIFRDNSDKLSAGMNLSMIKMGIHILAQELHIETPTHCLRELEEFFRLTLRKHLNGDILLGFVDINKQEINYSGCGNVPAYYISSQSSFEKLELDCKTTDSNQIQNRKNKQLDFPKGSSLFISSPGIRHILSEQEIIDIRDETEAILSKNPKSAHITQLNSFLRTKLSENMHESLCFLTIFNHNSGEKS